MSAAAASTSAGWTPIVNIPAGIIGGIETGRAVRLPARATRAEAAAAALDAMRAWPAALSCTAERATLRALPGSWREVGGLDRLVRLDTPAVTPGMVVVARAGEDWQHRPELRFQVWPGDLEEVPTC